MESNTNTTPPETNAVDTVDKKLDLKSSVKCGNCNYIGPGKLARRLISKIIAWIFIVINPLITAIYFLATHKYKCPQCGSSFVGVKNKEGAYVAQKSGAAIYLIIALLTLFAIATIGILASVVLASLNSAREKALEAQKAGDVQMTLGEESLNESAEVILNPGWINYDSPEHNFSVTFPNAPTLDSKAENDRGVYNWSSGTGESIFLVNHYVYGKSAAAADFDAILSELLQGFLESAKKSEPTTELVSSNYAYQASNRALDFVFKSEAGVARGRFIVTSESDYLVLVVYLSGDANETLRDNYINSFSVK